MASQLVLFVVWLSLIERVIGHQFKRVDQCGRYSRLKGPYSTGQAYSNIECMDNCLEDKDCVAVTSCAQDRTQWRTCDKNKNLADLHNCTNHETDEKCSTWQKLDPCQNGAPLINNTCVCPLPYKGVICQFYQPMSCTEIRQMSLNENQTAVTKTYLLYTSTQKRVKVFCDFKNETFGAMYIPKSSLSELTRPELKELVPDNKEFMLRERLTDKTEKETIISMLPRFQDLPWTITLGVDTTRFDTTHYHNTEPYIFIGGIPRDKIKETNHYGFVAHGKKFEYLCTDLSKSNYFIFYTQMAFDTRNRDTKECKKWQNEWKTNPQNPLPTAEYFYFAEIHIKCASWCVNTDFTAINGIAPGFIFN